MTRALCLLACLARLVSSRPDLGGYMCAAGYLGDVLWSRADLPFHERYLCNGRGLMSDKHPDTHQRYWLTLSGDARMVIHKINADFTWPTPEASDYITDDMRWLDSYQYCFYLTRTGQYGITRLSGPNTVDTDHYNYLQGDLRGAGDDYLAIQFDRNVAVYRRESPDSNALTGLFSEKTWNTNTAVDYVGKCMACPAGKYSPDTFTLCAPCPGGSYASVEGLAACLACPPGSYTATTGSTALSQCGACPNGQRPAASGLVCEACPQGRAGTGGACNLCGAGYFAASTGQTVCTTCVNGGDGALYSNAAGFTDTACPYTCDLGYYQGPTTCLPCNLGLYGATRGITSVAQCTACPAGTYSPNGLGASACTTCETGKFSATTGASICAACQTPKDCSKVCSYSHGPGVFVCTENSRQGCFNRLCSATRDLECTSCLSQSVQGCSRSLGACPPGQQPLENCSDSTRTTDTTCVACPPGKKQQGSDPVCTYCNAGYYASSASGCAPCTTVPAYK